RSTWLRTPPTRPSARSANILREISAAALATTTSCWRSPRERRSCAARPRAASRGWPRSRAVATIGTPVRRREDYRFLIGRGTYTDDINRPGQLYAYILRSPHARARIPEIDTATAQGAPGVVAVYTGKDMAADGVGGLPCGWQIHSKDGSPMAEPPHPVLAIDRVRHVGDPVAVVIAETKSEARDASELIVVDYEVLPAVTSSTAALKSAAPQ